MDGQCCADSNIEQVWGVCDERCTRAVHGDIGADGHCDADHLRNGQMAAWGEPHFNIRFGTAARAGAACQDVD
eukprot:7360642-Prymnesium_polylepis.2